MALSDGAQFAGYTVVRLLGAGGMGDVYLARHPRLPRFEALKILRADVSADADYRQRFNREADVAAGLWHPHIVGIHDRGDFDGQLWIAMDYVDGQDVGALLQHYPTGMPLHEVVAIVTAIGSALDYAHHRGLLHRDVKPGNIMISHPDGGGEARILLSDFGIARPIDDTTGLTVTNMSIGTVEYSAPEQLMGNPIDGRADQYALATTAYQLLTGTKLFAHVNPVGVIRAHLTAAPPLPGTIRPELACTDTVFARALAKNPADRFGRCSDFGAALAGQLQRFAARFGPPARPPHPGPPPPGHAPGGVPPQAPFAASPSLPAVPTSPVALRPTSAPARPPQFISPAELASIANKPSRKSRVLLLVSVLAAVTVLGTLGTIAAAKIVSSNAAKQAAQDRENARLAGQHYLEALAAGDAATALALGAQQPANKQLLTDKALRSQLAGMPITNIVVTRDAGQDSPTAADAQRLVLSATFGATPSKTMLWARKKDGDWKLDTTTIAVSVDQPAATDAAMQAVAISGVATNGANPVWVFPGAIQLSSANRYIDITAPPKQLLLEALTATNPAIIQPNVAINDVGRQASLAAVDAKARYCFNGTTPPADCCPKEGCQAVPPSGTGGNPGIVANTLKLLSMENTQNMTYDLDPNLMHVHVKGLINYVAQAQLGSQTITLREELSVDKFVDLTKEPPVVLPRAQ